MAKQDKSTGVDAPPPAPNPLPLPEGAIADQSVGQPPQDNQTPGEIDPDKPIWGQLDAEDMIPVKLRHKTTYATYRRTGIVITKTPTEHLVTKKQLEILVADTWVEVIGE